MCVNPDGSFATRPLPGAEYRGPDGETVTIAATWLGGVVFEGGPCCSARNLLARYKPSRSNQPRGNT